MIDESAANSGKEELGINVHYHTSTNEVVERLLAYLKRKAFSADGIHSSMKDVLKEITAPLITLGSDGASVMRGSALVVAAKLLKRCPDASCIFWYAHRMNLIDNEFL